MSRNDNWRMSRSTACRLALGAQGFADPPPRSGVDRRHLQRVMGRLNVIQLDSVPVIIRTQYLPFHSRLGPYRTELFDDVAYKSGRWFEAWAHEASLLPVTSEPLFRWLKQRCRDGKTWKGLARLAAEQPHYVEAVLREVKRRGVAKSSDLVGLDGKPEPASDKKSEGTEKHAGWWHRSDAKNALDWLYRIGELGVRRVGNFEKVYSPLSSVVPESILRQPTPDIAEAQRQLALQSVRSLGVGSAADIADYFRLPIGEVRQALRDLLEEGSIVSAAVEGWDKPAYADPGARVPRQIVGTTVLSPFDPIVWNRKRSQRLFDFEYKLEIYTPKEQRRWGYYVLPILSDGRLIGRIDAKTHRADGRLVIKAAYQEAGAGDDVAQKIGAASADLAVLVKAKTLEVVPNGDLGVALRSVIETYGDIKTL